MSWKIKLDTNTINYSFDGEEYETDEIYCSKSNWRIEKGTYKDPDDNICEEEYIAESEHGTFSWTIRATRTGWDSYGEIEDIYESIEPEDCEALDSPSFSIEIIEDEEEF